MIKLDQDIIKKNILTKFEENLAKNVVPRVYTSFSKIWPSDLLFYHIQPMIKLDREIIKTNILSKFGEDKAKNVAPRV